MKSIRTIIAVLLLSVGAINAQNSAITEEMKKINGSLKKYPSVKMDVSYVYYSSYSSKIPVETQKGIIKKKGDMQYWSLMGTATVVNSQYQVSIDSSYKRIFIGPKSKNSKTANLADVDFERLLKIYEKPISVSNGKSTGLKFTCKPGIHAEHKTIEIYYNKETYVVEKLVLFYTAEMPINTDREDGPKDKPRLEIIFSNINLDAKLTDSDFSEKKYVQINGDQYKPQPAYKAFSLIKNNTAL